jgi:hypothetical protein
MPRLTKAQAKKRMLEVKRKCMHVLFDAPQGIMFQKDMVDIERVVDRVLKRIN